MRLRIQHEISTTFVPALSHAIREIRMTPRTFDGQFVGEWRLDVDNDCRLDRVFDGYGNVVHDFSVAGSISELVIGAAGEVEVDDSAGVLPASSLDRVPAGVFLRDTTITAAGPALRAFAAEIAPTAGPLDRCHALMGTLADRFEWIGVEEDEKSGPCSKTADAAFEAARASPSCAAHIFIAAARSLGIPARYVSGYLWRGGPEDDGEAMHAWAEAFVPGLGWVGFDPQNARCPTDAYVRVSVGLDQHGAAWVRGADHGHAESLVTCRATITRVE